MSATLASEKYQEDHHMQGMQHLHFKQVAQMHQEQPHMCHQVLHHQYILKLRE